MVLATVLMACSPAKEPNTPIHGVVVDTEVSSPKVVALDVTPYEGEVTFEVGRSLIDLVGFNDNDVVAKTKIEYFPETDRVKNITEIEPGVAVARLFDKPFGDLQFRIINSGENGAAYTDVQAAVAQFGIFLTEPQIAAARAANQFDTVKISTNDISIYLLKVSESLFEIWVIELPADGKVFRSSLPLDLSPQELQTTLGEPNFKKKDESVFVYSFFSSLRQLNILWSEGKISRVQYITWNGI